MAHVAKVVHGTQVSESRIEAERRIIREARSITDQERRKELYAEAVKVLARAHQSMIWTRQATETQLSSRSLARPSSPKPAFPRPIATRCAGRWARVEYITIPTKRESITAAHTLVLRP